MREFTHRNKSWMVAELFHERDIVTPSFGALAGVRGVIAHVGPYITIEFPRSVKKYPHDPMSRASCRWGYEPSNVRLIAFAKPLLRIKKR